MCHFLGYYSREYKKRLREICWKQLVNGGSSLPPLWLLCPKSSAYLWSTSQITNKLISKDIPQIKIVSTAPISMLHQSQQRNIENQLQFLGSNCVGCSSLCTIQYIELQKVMYMPRWNQFLIRMLHPQQRRFVTLILDLNDLIRPIPLWTQQTLQ